MAPGRLAPGNTWPRGVCPNAGDTGCDTCEIQEDDRDDDRNGLDQGGDARRPRAEGAARVSQVRPPDRAVQHAVRRARLQQPLSARGISAARGQPGRALHPDLQLAQLEVRPARRAESLRRRGSAHLPGRDPGRRHLDRPRGAALRRTSRRGPRESCRGPARTTPTTAWRARSRACTGSARTPWTRCAEAIRWSAERMEFGWTHAYAGAADWLALYDENEGDDETRLGCVLEGVAHIADGRAAGAAPSVSRRRPALGRRGVRRRRRARGRSRRGVAAAGRHRRRARVRGLRAGPEPGGARPLQRLRPLADLRDQGGPPRRASRPRSLCAAPLLRSPADWCSRPART